MNRYLIGIVTGIGVIATTVGLVVLALPALAVGYFGLLVVCWIEDWHQWRRWFTSSAWRQRLRSRW